ncbi:DNA-directed RNA polymerase subunit beta' [candidate division WWE3 bacterium]|nr:DNA-directed RNA polymerase subunit beta' [candidate division WWE3 bacterium]
MQNNINFDALKLSLASAEDIRSWSHGEVTKAETINYRTLKPEKDGLFDERIFGPVKDLECYCGKYKRQRYKGVVCDKCGVEVTYARVRRERMGHIELAAPVVHTWFFKRIPNKLPALLNVGLRDLESVIYFAQFLVTEINEDRRAEILKRLNAELEEKKKQLETETNEQVEQLQSELEKTVKESSTSKDVAESDELRMENLKKENRRSILYLREELIRNQEQLEQSFKQVTEMINKIKMFSVVSELEMNELKFWEASDFFVAGMGAEVVLEALTKLDLEKEIEELKKVIKGKSKARRLKAIKRLKIIKGMKDAQINPAWIVMEALPVIPPDLRPMVQLPGGRFATSDLNDLYRRVINRNNRLRELIQLGAPSIILQNEKRMLQEAVDSLIEGSRKITRGRKELQSLSDMLKGKQGRFRQNLLGKRVDYSGRSVIVVGPTLKIDQVGVPKEMALELFKPFVLRDLILEGYAPNLKSAKHVLESRGDEVWDILERVTKNHPVLLNRAPTLHRQNIQAFYPVLVEGKAITFHPGVVGSFAGDFDGDSMSIHVPLSQAAIEEARTKLLTPHNLLKLSHGQPIVDLKHEISLGVYYLTLKNDKDERKGFWFLDSQQALSAYHNNEIDIQTPIRTIINGEEIETTPGRIIFNTLIPEDLRFINVEVNRDVTRDLIANCFDQHGEDETCRMLDRLKEQGQKFSTIAGVSYSMFDLHIPEERNIILNEAHAKIDEIEQNYQLGLMTPRERHLQIVSVWEDAQSKISKVVMEKLDKESVIGMILNSRSFKVNPETIRQVQGMRGLMVDSQGLIKETPITSSMLEGHTSFEGFLNMIGGRKSLIDVALLTATAGYLTRRLVDVAHDVMTREIDCGTKQGVYIRVEEGVEDWTLEERIEGRTAWKDIKDAKGNLLVAAGEEITQEIADNIVEAGIEEVPMRSILTCETHFGVCSKCYGKDLSTRKRIEIGEAVGIIAAQSIGEPGTQLTLHSKHRAGVAKKEITQGLPRVEQLFEARTPKQSATLSEITGTVMEIEEKSDGIVIVIKASDKTADQKDYEVRRYTLSTSEEIKVKVGDKILAGDSLTEGNFDLEEILEIKGVLSLQKHLLKEIQAVYKSQGVSINDKHIEVIIRKMCDKVRVKSSGDSSFLPGDYVSIYEFVDENKQLEAAGKETAKGSRVVLGISRAALLTDSWLSAASFEETANVLAAAAINERPQIDYLLGLKENVIIGRLIPTGKRARVEVDKLQSEVEAA